MDMQAKGIPLDSADFRMMLLSVLISLSMDTVAIETLHASLRRILTMLSVQTDPLHAQDLSAHDTLRQFRKYAATVNKLIGKSPMDVR